MQFRDGTSVYALDDQHVGHVDCVVLHPKTKEVTDVVVRKGFLFTEDKFVPLRLIIAADEDRISLRADAGKLYMLPSFEETYYIRLNEAESRNAGYPVGMALPFYSYPPMSGWTRYSGTPGHDFPPLYEEMTEQNIPEGTVALKEGVRSSAITINMSATWRRFSLNLPGIGWRIS